MKTWNYRDFGYDERKKIAQIREEVARLTKVLNNAVLGKAGSALVGVSLKL